MTTSAAGSTPIGITGSTGDWAGGLPMVGDDGVIRGPAGDGRVAAVAEDDIADAAVAVLEALEEAYASRAGCGAPEWQVDAWVSTYTAIAASELEPVTTDVERLTGHPATTVAEVLAGIRPTDAG